MSYGWWQGFLEESLALLAGLAWMRMTTRELMMEEVEVGVELEVATMMKEMQGQAQGYPWWWGECTWDAHYPFSPRKTIDTWLGLACVKEEEEEATKVQGWAWAIWKLSAPSAFCFVLFRFVLSCLVLSCACLGTSSAIPVSSEVTWMSQPH